MPIKKIVKKKESNPDYRLSDGVTQSMLSDFLTCRQKSRLKLDRWESSFERGPGALERGDFIHFVLERIYQAGGLPIEQLFTLWCKAKGHDESHPDIIPIGEICSALLPAYITFWEKRDVKYKWIALEKTFDIMWNGIRLRGKIDGILEVNGQIYIFETKTMAQVDEDCIMDKLQFDFQNFFYLTVCRDILNINVKGIIYNIIRWPNSRLKKDLAGHIREDQSHYFKRYEVAYSLKDVQVFRDELKAILRDYQDWFAGKLSHYKNPSACFKGNMKCEFLKICSSGTTSGFSKSRTLFRELL